MATEDQKDLEWARIIQATHALDDAVEEVVRALNRTDASVPVTKEQKQGVIDMYSYPLRHL
jgi:hypothetical protein